MVTVLGKEMGVLSPLDHLLWQHGVWIFKQYWKYEIIRE